MEWVLAALVQMPHSTPFLCFQSMDLELPKLGSSYSYKFAGDNGFALDTSINKPILLDKSKMCASAPFASTVKDRWGDVMEVTGIFTGNHQMNPVSMLDHGKYWPLAIGVTESPSGEYLVRIDKEAGEAWQTTYFSQSCKVAAQVFALIDEKIIRGGSIGYKSLEVRDLPGAKTPAGRYPQHILRCELWETTWSCLPVNPEVVRCCIDRDQIEGKSLLPQIRRNLEPYAQPRKIWSPGSNVEKNMSEEVKAPEKKEEPVPEVKAVVVPPEKKSEEMPKPAGEVNKEAEPTGEKDMETHSAQAHRMVYEHCKSIQAAHEERLPELMEKIHPLDHEESKKFLTKHLENISKDLDKRMATHEDAFEKHHPDLPPLAGEEGEEHKEDEVKEKKEGEVPPKEEKSAATPEVKAAVTSPEKKSEAMSSVSETSGGPLVAPPEHSMHMKKAADWLCELGHEGKHPNLDNGQKAACLYHGEKLGGLGNGIMPKLETKSVPAPVEPEQTQEEKEALALISGALTDLNGKVDTIAKTNAKVERRLRQAGVAVK